jgi:hypothetical protein
MLVMYSLVTRKEPGDGKRMRVTIVFAILRRIRHSLFELPSTRARKQTYVSGYRDGKGIYYVGRRRSSY